MMMQLVHITQEEYTWAKEFIGNKWILKTVSSEGLVPKLWIWNCHLLDRFWHLTIFSPPPIYESHFPPLMKMRPTKKQISSFHLFYHHPHVRRRFNLDLSFLTENNSTKNFHIQNWYTMPWDMLGLGYFRHPSFLIFWDIFLILLIPKLYSFFFEWLHQFFHKFSDLSISINC